MEIKRSILQYILSKEEDCISPERADWMATHLSRFVEDAADKFIAGQKEHDCEIEFCDLRRELRQEIMDSLWYISAITHPLKPATQKSNSHNI